MYDRRYHDSLYDRQREHLIRLEQEEEDNRFYEEQLAKKKKAKEDATKVQDNDTTEATVDTETQTNTTNQANTTVNDSKSNEPKVSGEEHTSGEPKTIEKQQSLQAGNWYKNEKTGKIAWSEAESKLGEQVSLKGSTDTWTNIGQNTSQEAKDAVTKHNFDLHLKEHPPLASGRLDSDYTFDGGAVWGVAIKNIVGGAFKYIGSKLFGGAATKAVTKTATETVEQITAKNTTQLGSELIDDGLKMVEQPLVQAAKKELPRSGPIMKALGAASRSEMLAKKLKLNINSPTTRQVLNSLDDTVESFITQFRKSTIRSELPGEFLNGTVEEALRSGNTTVRKLLIDNRFVK